MQGSLLLGRVHFVQTKTLQNYLAVSFESWIHAEWNWLYCLAGQCKSKAALQLYRYKAIPHLALCGGGALQWHSHISLIWLLHGKILIWSNRREGTTFLGSETASEERKSSSFVRPVFIAGRNSWPHKPSNFKPFNFFLQTSTFNIHRFCLY